MKFELNEKQQKKLDKWYKKLGNNYSGACGGGIDYIFTPTSLGMIVKVVCNGKEIDLTNKKEFG